MTKSTDAFVTSYVRNGYSTVPALPVFENGSQSLYSIIGRILYTGHLYLVNGYWYIGFK